jgi:hypothetical protein
MIQKVLFPRWNDLSSQQKTLVKEWIESLIKLEASKKKLCDNLFDIYSENQSDSIGAFPSDFSVEVEDSSTTSEGIKIEKIISFSNLKAKSPDNNCEAVCAAICNGSNLPNCLQICSEQLCGKKNITH